MNNIRYANIHVLGYKKILSDGVVREQHPLSIYAGMYTLTLLTKEGFRGYRKLLEEQAQDREYALRKAVYQALHTDIVTPIEKRL